MPVPVVRAHGVGHTIKPARDAVDESKIGDSADNDAVADDAVSGNST
jgi:hypothetical protein